LSGERRSRGNGVDGESSSTATERGRIFEERSVLLLLLREREAVSVVGRIGESSHEIETRSGRSDESFVHHVVDRAESTG